MIGKQTGEKLNLRYAFPCKETPFGAIAGRGVGTLSPKHQAEILDLVLYDGQPRRSLFRFCYPYAYRALCAYAKKEGLERWALATVTEFWRHHHGHRGECRVRRALVLEVSSDNARAFVDCDGERLPIINYYRLPLRKDQYVYFHFRVIAEIEGFDD